MAKKAKAPAKVNKTLSNKQNVRNLVDAGKSSTEIHAMLVAAGVKSSKGAVQVEVSRYYSEFAV